MAKAKSEAVKKPRWKKNMSADEEAAYKEAKREETKYYMDMIDNGIDEVLTSDRYAEYLKVMTRFHDYSFNNSLLILQQKPDASYVLSFKQWKEIGRHVKKGETGIRILAPITIKKDADERLADSPEKKEQVVGFKPVSVFDISQTDGKPLPELTRPLEGHVENFDELRAALEQATNFSVKTRRLPEDTNGYADARTKTIVINEGLSEPMQIKTLSHEIGHAIMHPLGNAVPRDIREMQAESAAFMISAHFGIDTSDYTFPYLISWHANEKRNAWRTAVEPARRVASEVIEKVEEILEKNREKTLSQPLETTEKNSSDTHGREAGQAKQSPKREKTQEAAER